MRPLLWFISRATVSERQPAARSGSRANTRRTSGSPLAWSARMRRSSPKSSRTLRSASARRDPVRSRLVQCREQFISGSLSSVNCAVQESTRREGRVLTREERRPLGGTDNMSIPSELPRTERRVGPEHVRVVRPDIKPRVPGPSIPLSRNVFVEHGHDLLDNTCWSWTVSLLYVERRGLLGAEVDRDEPAAVSTGAIA